MCGKKRVRRIQMELPKLRRQAKDLELQLQLLKLQRSSSKTDITTEVLSPRSVPSLEEKAPPRPQNSAWNGIAERQFNDRLRAEQQQQELKEKYDDLWDLSVALQKLLQKYECQNKEAGERATGAKQLRYWDLNADPEDKVFAAQLTIATRIRLEMQQLRPTPCRTLTPSFGLAMGRVLVRWDPNVEAGFTLDVQCGSMLPFSLKVAADAYWRLLLSGYRPEDASRIEADLSVGTVARSFKIRTDFEGFTSKARDKYTARRFFDEDGGVVITFAGSTDVHEFDGVEFSGMQMHKRGFIKFRPVPRQGPGQQSTSTVVEISIEMIPVFHDSVDQAQQTQMLLARIDNSYAKVDRLYCQHMGALLLEEDWKATFSRE